MPHDIVIIPHTDIVQSLGQPIPTLPALVAFIPTLPHQSAYTKAPEVPWYNWAIHVDHTAVTLAIPAP